MDTTRWKSVAVSIESYRLLQALGDLEFRRPASMIAKLVNDLVKVQAEENKKNPKIYKKELLNGEYQNDALLDEHSLN
tara:strand:+ start:132 stop:365 length:234 start_codon:yes stop_codon:yes gene_type:complete